MGGRTAPYLVCHVGLVQLGGTDDIEREGHGYLSVCVS